MSHRERIKRRTHAIWFAPIHIRNVINLRAFVIRVVDRAPFLCSSPPPATSTDSVSDVYALWKFHFGKKLKWFLDEAKSNHSMPRLIGWHQTLRLDYEKFIFYLSEIRYCFFSNISFQFELSSRAIIIIIQMIIIWHLWEHRSTTTAGIKMLSANELSLLSHKIHRRRLAYGFPTFGPQSTKEHSNI